MALDHNPLQSHAQEVEQRLAGLRAVVGETAANFKDVSGTLAARVRFLDEQYQQACWEQKEEQEHSNRLSVAFAKEVQRRDALQQEKENHQQQCSELQESIDAA